MPKTSGILETILYVEDVDRAAKWYSSIFGFPVITEVEDRLRALDDGAGRVLLLFKQGASTAPATLPGGVIPAHDGSGPAHIAFGMETEDAQQWEPHLNANGVSVESRVSWPVGATSLYFRDPDNHLVELISSGYWAASR